MYFLLLFIAADCYLNNSEEYRGTIDYTVSGKTCQAWNVNFPHTVDYQPIDPTAGTTNYCRETTHKEGGPVCYTTDPVMKWEYCFIVKCTYFDFDIIKNVILETLKAEFSINYKNHPMFLNFDQFKA